VSRARCVHGHAWTTANTYVDPRGERRCRRCAAARIARVRLEAVEPVINVEFARVLSWRRAMREAAR
jgi:hypothetical protein